MGNKNKCSTYLKATPTLKGKDAEKFIKKCKENEKSQITLTEYKRMEKFINMMRQ